MSKLKTIFVLVTIVAALSSCGGKTTNDAEQAAAQQRADSILQDSLLKVAEAARLDSIRQDSIKQAEAISKIIPEPKKIKWPESSELAAYLKKLGYAGSYKPEDDGGEECTKGKYTLTQNDVTVTVSWTEYFNSFETKITINGADEALQEFYQKALKLKSASQEGGTDVSIKNNTVTINSYGA